MISRVSRSRPDLGRDVARTFLRWTYLRAVCHRGHVLVSSLYFVVDARLSASQLLLLGTVVAATMVLSDVPTGIWADAWSRKWPIVIGHLFLAAGMVMLGLVTAFPLIVATQVLWGVGWAFSTGADVAWVTDELDQPERIDRVLAARARWDLVGQATGMVAFGLLGWAAGLGTAIVVSGLAMALLGLYVAARFGETHVTPAREQRWRVSWSILRRGVTLARRDDEIRLVFAATLLINGAGVISWLFPQQLVTLGLPNDPLLWYTALGIVAFAAGAVALRLVEERIEDLGVARRIYALELRRRRARPARAGGRAERPPRRRWRAALERDRVQRHAGGRRHLGEPAHHERRAGDRPLVSLPGRNGRQEPRRGRARRPRPGRRQCGRAARRRLPRGDRRGAGRAVPRRPRAVRGDRRQRVSAQLTSQLPHRLMRPAARAMAHRRRRFDDAGGTPGPVAVRRRPYQANPRASPDAVIDSSNLTRRSRIAAATAGLVPNWAETAQSNSCPGYCR